MPKNHAQFTWNNVIYTIPTDTVRRKILLPNGIVLSFNSFYFSDPPTIKDLTALSFTVSILPETPLLSVALDLNALLAIELGFCPNHPDQTGNFCSICGQRITTPKISPPKPFPIMGTVTLAVKSDDPCPHCQQPLDYKKIQSEECPNCRGKLFWVHRYS